MTPIQKALFTWYSADHPLHNDPLHPAIGLAGEAGEILDLYKKDRFKDGFSWWDCVHCKESEDWHSKNNSWCGGWWNEEEKVTIYTPKILDELGDLWFYLRILAYQKEVDFSAFVLGRDKSVSNDMLLVLSRLNFRCGKLLIIYNSFEPGALHYVADWFLDALDLLPYTLDQLTELNWAKLKDGDNHGWQSTAQSL